jgi:hypothetical protein
MRWKVLWLVPLLVVGSVLWADDKAKDKDKDDKTPKAGEKTPADEYKALMADVKKAQGEVVSALQKAKNEDERQTLIADYYKRTGEFAPRFLAVAQKYPKDKVAYDALTFIVENGGEGTDTDKAIEMFLKDHADKVAGLVPRLARAQSSAAVVFLRAVAKENPEHRLRGRALFTLAKVLKNQTDNPGVEEAKKEKMAKEAEEALTRVTEKYADVDKLADQAKSELFEIRHLSIGKEAPEIEAEDIDGKKFKLSDYRGKVVVLDFWGNW